MAEFVSARVYEVRAQMNAGQINEAEKVCMLHRLLQHRYPSNTTMPDLDVISEAMGHMIAGSDTTSTSLSYFFWELSRRPDVMKKLQAELYNVMPDSRTIPDILVLQKLPYLNMFIKEAYVYTAQHQVFLNELCLLPRLKMGLPTRYLISWATLYPWAPGTIVSTQAWSMHCDASIFPSPETFLPDRWLETHENGEQLSTAAHVAAHDAIRNWLPCMWGQNLAQVILKITVASVARNFDVSMPPETNERSMEMKDSFVLVRLDHVVFSAQVTTSRRNLDTVCSHMYCLLFWLFALLCYVCILLLILINALTVL